MRTRFTEAQRADPDVRRADAILRTCVHCGFCTATCPTYVLRGDEPDSPRGRIYLIQDWLETGGPPPETTVTHLDRCLSCLSCMSTCPSGVDYMHLVDLARERIAGQYRRPLGERLLRRLLATVLPEPRRARPLLRLGGPVRPLARFLPGRLATLAGLMPDRLPPPGPGEGPAVSPAEGTQRGRVALLTGCVQKVLDPEINAATIRLLTRQGIEVVVAEGSGCCGALEHHLGAGKSAAARARANVAAWIRELEGTGLDAILVNASGCGTTVKDYATLLRGDPDWAEPAARVAALARDVTEYLAERPLPAPVRALSGMRVACHDACSLQHGQGVRARPRALLRAAGFTLVEVPEGHLCCGSAGTYNLLQPELADRLLARKAAHLDSTGADVAAAGNIGCLVQIRREAATPIVHTVQLLDWATGGPRPAGV